MSANNLNSICSYNETGLYFSNIGIAFTAGVVAGGMVSLYQYGKLSGEFNELKNQNTKLTEENHLSQKQIVELTTKNVHLSEENAQLSEKLNQYAKENEKLHKRVDQLNKNTLLLSQEMSELSNQLHEKHQDLNHITKFYQASIRRELQAPSPKWAALKAKVQKQLNHFRPINEEDNRRRARSPSI